MITPSFSPTATERVLPKLALDFTTASLDPRVTFTRTTGASNPATYVNSSGYVTAATNNQPRFDYSPTALTCKGLLIEESRANKCLYSEQFDNVNWTISELLAFGSGSVVNATTAPDNTVTADLIVPTTNNVATHYIRQGFATTNGISVTMSVYVKAAGYTTLSLRLVNTGAPIVKYDMVALTADNVAGTIVDAGNGWRRVTLTGTTSSTSVTGYIYPNQQASYAGDGTSGIYVWGCQYEEGAFATSYIPTTSAALTRNADVATMTGTNFSSWYNQSQGTFFTQYQLEGWATTQSRCGLGVSNGTTASRMRHLVTSLTQSGFIGDGSGTSATLLQTVPNVTQNVNKSAAGYKLNDVGACANAGNVGTDLSFTPPTVDRAFIGSNEVDGGSAFLNGWIQKIMYYPQRLLNAELQAITK